LHSRGHTIGFKHNEGEWLKLLGELNDIPVIPVGLLLPSTQESGDNNKDSTWGTVGEWLDKQEKGSVVYIALRSEIQPSQQDFTELALGLAQSGLPFFWALRKRIELLEGFEERTRGRGVVWTGWALQLKILAHDLVGGFLTHCGWSSVTEAFQFGRALFQIFLKSRSAYKVQKLGNHQSITQRLNEGRDKELSHFLD
jgi:hypothetical protein